jgi:hypothetical protein
VQSHPSGLSQQVNALKPPNTHKHAVFLTVASGQLPFPGLCTLRERHQIRSLADPLNQLADGLHCTVASRNITLVV